MSKFKEGDVVAIIESGIGRRITKAVIDSVTPSGQLRIGKRRFTKFGREMVAVHHRSTACLAWLEAWYDGYDEELQEQERQNGIRFLMDKRRWDKVPLSVIREVIKFIDENETE